MSDLETERDWCRQQSISEHKPTCEAIDTRGFLPRHIRPDPRCPGCMTDQERADWAERADEIDAYLAPSNEAGLLGGSMTRDALQALSRPRRVGVGPRLHRCDFRPSERLLRFRG